MLTDTSPNAEQVQLRLLREKSPAERAGMALRLSSLMIRAGKRAIARACPSFTDEQVSGKFIELHYGLTFENVSLSESSGATMHDASELESALRPLAEAFDRLGVRYYVGGSVASSFHGAVRSTLDVDVAAELNEGTALELIGTLQNEYYVSQPAVLEAVRRHACFNLIHLASSFKVDVFVSRGRAFDRSVQQRALIQAFGDASWSAPVATAADVVLLKLEGYRLGNETSERQWNDIALVAKIQGAQLDRDYLRRWADGLGVMDLLERLLAEVGNGAQ